MTDFKSKRNVQDTVVLAAKSFELTIVARHMLPTRYHEGLQDGLIESRDQWFRFATTTLGEMRTGDFRKAVLKEAAEQLTRFTESKDSVRGLLDGYELMTNHILRAFGISTTPYEIMMLKSKNEIEKSCNSA